jgi:hypothetical protein
MDRLMGGCANMLAVAIHDVEPRSFARTRVIRSWLAERGIDRVTMLVIPAPDLHPIGARAPELAAWLRQSRSGGLMRLDVHPADFDLPGHLATIEWVLELAEGRRVITYDELGG